MKSLSVVEDFDVIKQLALGIAKVLEVFAEFKFESTIPALDNRVVNAVPSSTHAASDAVFFEQVLVVIACIGTASIRVMKQSGFGSTSPERHI